MVTGQRISTKDFLESELSGQARFRRSKISQTDKNIKISGGNNIPEEKRSKYNNKKTRIDGILFDSKWEGERYCQLKTLERIGEISNLRLQVPYDLCVNGMKICTYKADFVYIMNEKEVVEDAKGAITKEYALKRKMMKAIEGIDIFESKRAK
jgi:hypothetical protein